MLLHGVGTFPTEAKRQSVVGGVGQDGPVQVAGRKNGAVDEAIQIGELIQGGFLDHFWEAEPILMRSINERVPKEWRVMEDW